MILSFFLSFAMEKEDAIFISENLFYPTDDPMMILELG